MDLYNIKGKSLEQIKKTPFKLEKTSIQNIQQMAIKNFFPFLFSLLFITEAFSQSQSLKDSGIDQYKYIIVEETTYKNSRKILLKELKKTGYNVVDINDSFPKDLSDNLSLGVKIISVEECPNNCSAKVYLLTNQNIPIWESRTMTSGLSSGNALKKALISKKLHMSIKLKILCVRFYNHIY